ncbi:MAG: ferritin family protein [Dehalococcoidales bacterium]|nr:ferritin family protein [Dehalococcoidales bacterium]
MPTEQDKTTQALQYAIQMEIDGKAFYLKAGQDSGNELGKKLLESLASQEDYHRQKFEQIYENIRKAKGWTGIDFQPDGGKTLRTIFARELDKPDPKFKVARTEIAAIEKAMEMEDRSYDFYHDRSEQVGPGTEQEFYDTIAAEEREHKMVLLDYYEFLKNPAAWFVKKEHTSMDG